MKFRTEQLPNNGFISVCFSDEELEPIRKEIEKIQKSGFTDAIDHRSFLAGNIKKEFELVDSVEHIEKIMKPICLEHDKSFNYTETVITTFKKKSIFLSSVWANFQEKYEFNPIHSHSGVYSFVIWLDIPFDNLKEISNEHSIRTNSPVSGNFEFVYTDILGKIKTFRIAADTHSRNVGLLFPSELRHCVYPFYTSDQHRISIAGNFSHIS